MQLGNWLKRFWQSDGVTAIAEAEPASANHSVDVINTSAIQRRTIASCLASVARQRVLASTARYSCIIYVCLSVYRTLTPVLCLDK